MNESSCRIGFAFTGSFCTFAAVMSTLEAVKARFGDVTPIVSEASGTLDTRFGNAADWRREMERICQKPIIDTLQKAEPIGPKRERPKTSGCCWTKSTPSSSPSARTIPQVSPPPWWPISPWSLTRWPPPWRGSRSSPWCWGPKRNRFSNALL